MVPNFQPWITRLTPTVDSSRLALSTSWSESFFRPLLLMAKIS